MSVLVYSMMLDGALSSNNRTLTSAFRAQTSRNLELLLATGLLNGDTLDDAHVLIRIIKSITYTPYKYTHKSAHVMTHVLVDAEFLLVFFLGLDEHWLVKAQAPLAIRVTPDDLVDHLRLRSALPCLPRLDVLMWR